MSDDLETLRAQIAALCNRIDLLERETFAYSLLFRGLIGAFSPNFIVGAQYVGQLLENNINASPEERRHATEALRIIEDLMREPLKRPPPGQVI